MGVWNNKRALGEVPRQSDKISNTNRNHWWQGEGRENDTYKGPKQQINLAMEQQVV